VSRSCADSRFQFTGCGVSGTSASLTRGGPSNTSGSSSSGPSPLVGSVPGGSASGVWSVMMLGSRRSQADGRGLRCLGGSGRWLERGRVPLRCCAAWGAVDLVTGAGSVVTDLLGHELLALDRLAASFVVDLAGVALGDEVVALGEPVMRVLGRPAEHHKMVISRLGLGERSVVLATEV